MGFKFRDLAVTLTPSLVGGKPEVKVDIKTCGGQTFKLLYKTCGTDTQQACTTHPQDLKLHGPGASGDFAELQKLLEEMLRKFDPA